MVSLNGKQGLTSDVDDLALLRRYVDCGSEQAFAELVERHLSWVYAMCRKGLAGDKHAAEDAAQAVFIILSRRAGEIVTRDVRVSGWLFNTARFVVKDARKKEARYRKRETAAREMNERRLTAAPSKVDPQMQGALDDALATLTEKDRHVLIMHFYEGLGLQEMADALEISKDGAKKRVARALARLRARLGRKGAVAPVLFVAMLMRSRAAEAAPVGLAKSAVSAAVAPPGLGI